VSAQPLRQAPESPVFLTPWVLIRSAAIPVSAIRGLRTERSAALVGEILAEEGWRTLHVEAVCETLFKAFKACGDDALEDRRLLLKAKRDVFNDREVDGPVLARARQHLSSEDFEKLSEWHGRYRRRRALMAEGEGALQEEMVERRRQLQGLAQHPVLMRGLSLASDSLIEKLRRYSDTKVEQQDARLRKVEIGLLSYLSRAAMKTSPFGAFTAVTLGEWSTDASVGLISLEPRQVELKGQIQVGHLPFRQLQEAIQRHPALRLHVPLWTNPHQWVKDGRRHVFRRLEAGPPRSGISHATERLSALSETPQLASFCNLIHPGETYAQAVQRLTSPTASAPKVSQLVDRLLETGILLREFDLPEQEWDLVSALRKKLEAIPVEPAPALVTKLATLEEGYRRFEATPAMERGALLGSMKAVLKEAFDLVQGKLAPEWAECLVYEDVTIPDVKARVGSGLWEEGREDFVLLQRLMSLFSNRSLCRRMLTHAFTQLHGTGGTCENLLDFYERSRRMFPAEMEVLAQQRYGREPVLKVAHLPWIPEADLRELQGLRQEVIDCVREQRNRPEAVWEVPREWLRNLCARVPADFLSPWASFAYLAQGIPGKKPLAVLNAAYSGQGPFFARFAALTGGLDPANNPLCQGMLEVQQKLLPPGHALAELLGVFSFNACLHPQQTPFQLRYPGCWAEPGNKTALQLGDLRLLHDVQENRLRFMGPDGTELHPAYLGLLVPRLTPPFFQFLLQFAEMERYPLSLPSLVEMSSPLEERDTPRAYPRVQLGRLVLSRRWWRLTREQLPPRAPAGQGFGYLLEINRWRERLGLPKTVFVRQGRSPSGLKSTDGERKPQFIDFENPFLLRLFDRMLGSVYQTLLVEEALPGMEEQALALSDGVHASEILMEVNEARWRAGSDRHG